MAKWTQKSQDSKYRFQHSPFLSQSWYSTIECHLEPPCLFSFVAILLRKGLSMGRSRSSKERDHSILYRCVCQHTGNPLYIIFFYNQERALKCEHKHGSPLGFLYSFKTVDLLSAVMIASVTTDSFTAAADLTLTSESWKKCWSSYAQILKGNKKNGPEKKIN